MEKGASIKKRDKTNIVGLSLLSDLAKSKKKKPAATLCPLASLS